MPILGYLPILVSTASANYGGGGGGGGEEAGGGYVCFFFCGHVVVGGLEFFLSVMCRIMICIHFYKHTHRRRPPSDRGAGPPAGADRAGASVDRGEQRRGV